MPALGVSISGRVCKAWLKVEAGVALRIAKHYLQLRDAKSVERLNTDWCLQIFCGIHLRPHEIIKDEDLPGRWRRYIGQHLEAQNSPKQHAQHTVVGEACPMHKKKKK
jgi:hypothetical protein